MQDMGINKLANMFMGNPQPLAQKVKQAQQQTKPGQIPPDLEQAIALQKIQEMRQAAQNQQAMQAGGPQPTVVEKLRQMIQPQLQMQGQPQGMPPAAPQANMPQGMPPQAGIPQGLLQAMPQGGMQPVQAAHGGHIAQLMSNLGNNYGGGGIVAFDDGGDVEDPLKDYLRSNFAAPPRTPAQIAADKLLERSVLTTPDQERERALAEYKKTVPERDTSFYDRAAEELDKRKQQMNAPATGMPALMEYLRQIALAPKGVGSLTAGAMGAQKVSELQQNREQQQFDLTKQILEQQQKKADVIRSDARDKFGIGDAAYNAMFKRNFEAALKITGDELEAEKMAKQATDNQLNRESQEKMAKERNDNSMAVANAPGQTERLAARIEKLRAQGTPEADAQIKQILDTHAQITGSGAAGVGAQRNRIMELKLDLATNKELLKNAESNEERKEALDNIKSLQAELASATKVQVTPFKIPEDNPFTVTAGGKTYTFPTQAAADKFKKEAGVK